MLAAGRAGGRWGAILAALLVIVVLLAAQGGEPRGAWRAARVALFLSWGCFGFLSRAVHCNSGRPELWVPLPGD